MKYCLILSVLLHLKMYSQFSTSSSSISHLEVNYLVKFQRDTANTQSLSQEVASLLIGEKTSVFKSTQKVIYDSLTLAEVDKSIKNAGGGTVMLNLQNVPSPRIISEVYKDSDRVYIYDEVLKTGFLYPVDAKLDWNILNETKIISGYTCRRAEVTFNRRSYTAWFTADLPFSEGPYIFKGLPGLVLEVSDSANLYSFQLAGLKKVVKPIVAPSGIETTHTKFSKVRSDFMGDPVGVFESQTKFKTPFKDRDRIIKLHQSNNNFIF
ncbi:GLPGLI family protein [Marnyiella aurantia]|uniref:GLPGLI family protein n=2 Tax=Marnyiella aurantia TaxID=2758037 RepID=A0A838ZAG7_9FLAO|nr:GLPGLI family protein [Marnyiella aurantia]MBA5246808.1 GLPGLI family protein [Marnyiella aurantia]